MWVVRTYLLGAELLGPRLPRSRIRVAQPVLPRHSVKLLGCQPLFFQEPVSKHASKLATNLMLKYSSP